MFKSVQGFDEIVSVSRKEDDDDVIDKNNINKTVYKTFTVRL